MQEREEVDMKELFQLSQKQIQERLGISQEKAERIMKSDAWQFALAMENAQEEEGKKENGIND